MSRTNPQEERMDKPNRVPQIYGYTVCVIAVVTALITASVIVNNVFDLANPIAAGFGNESSLSSFEAYQATYLKDQRLGAAGAEVRPDTASLATLHKRYDAVRADRISRIQFQAWKAIVTSGLLLVISVVLFAMHWRWMRKLGATSDVTVT
jgi:hypothetical protein